MSADNVKLVELNAENWYECCKLEISSGQEKYIESNAISIAQSKFEHTLKPYAIYFEERIVGFLMYNSIQEELEGYWVYRIMVDEKFQNMGIGKAATNLMILQMSKLPNAKKIVVGYHPENFQAHNLYSSMEFIDNGHRFGKEMAVIKYINE